MRLYPAVWGVFRQPVKDDEVVGQSVPAGTTILIGQWLRQRDPRWFQNPNALLPKPWLEPVELETLKQRLPKYAYFPFDGGPRICIANSFALLEAQVLMVIAQRYRLERDSQAPLGLRPFENDVGTGPIRAWMIEPSRARKRI